MEKYSDIIYKKNLRVLELLLPVPWGETSIENILMGLWGSHVNQVGWEDSSESVAFCVCHPTLCRLTRPGSLDLGLCDLMCL